MAVQYTAGQRVRILALIGNDGRADPQIQRYVNEIGTVVKAYCITRDEFPDLSKMVVYLDIDCYDVQLEGDGTILPGIPSVALEPRGIGSI
ncbi:hypothetical protein ACFLWU_02255 [Chloroflexota bacterium]